MDEEEMNRRLEKVAVEESIEALSNMMSDLYDNLRRHGVNRKDAAYMTSEIAKSMLGVGK